MRRWRESQGWERLHYTAVLQWCVNSALWTPGGPAVAVQSHVTSLLDPNALLRHKCHNDFKVHSAYLLQQILHAACRRRRFIQCETAARSFAQSHTQAAIEAA